MAVRVGINGFGRIGRNIMRAALGDANIDFIAVNDLTNATTLAHLLKYDSVLGNIHATVEAKGDSISVDGDGFKVLSMRDPAQLPWKDLGVDVVFESTGLFTKKTTADEVNSALREAAAGPLKNILAYSTAELVSIDFKGNANSSIVDAPCTKVMDGDFVKVLSWYDNEWGYSNRCVDLLRLLVKRGI